MFKFLKDKLKGAISSLSKKVEEEPLEGPEPSLPEPKKGIFQRLKEKVVGPAEEKESAIERLNKEAQKTLEKKPKKDNLDADRIEALIKDVDLKAPTRVETEPEPVPEEAKVEEEVIQPPSLFVPPQKVEEEVEEEPEEVTVLKSVAKKQAQVEKIELPEPILEKHVPKIAKPERTIPKVEAKPVLEVPRPEPARVEEPVEKKGFFGRIAEAITTKKVSAEEFENLFWELEVVLLENNVAVEVIEKIKKDLALSLVDKPIPRGKVEQTITTALRGSIKEVLDLAPLDILAKAKEKKPFIIAFVGVNGSGKTTTIAKVAHMLLENKQTVVLAAADTFRAAAIDQLEMHAKKLGVKIVKHDYGADPAAVAFDAVKHAQAKNVDFVLIDTAGRLHSNINLVDEMKKIMRVAKPDLKIFVGESITGNDCVEQAQQFNEAIGIDGIILTKADVDEKGGAAISVSYITKKPILYLGMGQEYADLMPFNGEQVLNSIGLNA